MNKPTVSTAALIQMADSTERSARDNLQAWTILGQTDKFSAAMDRAAALRRATEIRSMAQRREYLRNNGISA